LGHVEDAIAGLLFVWNGRRSKATAKAKPTATAKANAGVLGCAQNDNFFL
jgi:hypothetical protein